MSEAIVPTGGSPQGGRALLVQLVFWIGWAITTFFLILRVYAKFTIIRVTGWSLVWALASYTFGTVAIALVSVACTYGFANHMQTILETGGPQAVSNATKFFWLGAFFSIAGTGLSKVAACAFLLEVQSRKHRFGRIFLWFLAVTSIVVNFAGMFVLLFQCNPPQKAWNPTVSGECNVATSGKGLDFNYFISAWQAATDLCITFYPLLIIWGLNITTRMKISLSLLMSVSLFAFASCTVKTIEQRHFNDRGDLTYLFAPVPIWDAADLWVFLTVTSIPPLWPFFRFYFARATAKIHGRDVNEAGAGAIQMSLYKGGRGKGATATKVDNRGFPLKKVDSEDSDTYAYFLPQDGIVMTTEIAVDQEERRKSQFRKSQRRGLPRSPFSTDSVIMAGGGGIHGAQNTTKAEFTGEAVRDKI